jgi:hypothetical protein
MNAQTIIADDERRPFHAVYVKAEPVYGQPLTEEDKLKVEEATRYEMTHFYGEGRHVLKLKGKRRAYR